jgi:hypothetical protein
MFFPKKAVSPLKSIFTHTDKVPRSFIAGMRPERCYLLVAMSLLWAHLNLAFANDLYNSSLDIQQRCHSWAVAQTGFDPTATAGTSPLNQADAIVREPPQQIESYNRAKAACTLSVGNAERSSNAHDPESNVDGSFDSSAAPLGMPAKGSKPDAKKITAQPDEAHDNWTTSRKQAWKNECFWGAERRTAERYRIAGVDPTADDIALHQALNGEFCNCLLEYIARKYSEDEYDANETQIIDRIRVETLNLRKGINNLECDQRIVDLNMRMLEIQNLRF